MEVPPSNGNNDGRSGALLFLNLLKTYGYACYSRVPIATISPPSGVPQLRRFSALLALRRVVRFSALAEERLPHAAHPGITLHSTAKEVAAA